MITVRSVNMNCCVGCLLRLSLFMMCLLGSVSSYGADLELQWESFLNCTNISLHSVKVANLALGISASVCCLFSTLILILLLCFKEYKTPFQRMYVFLILLTIVQEAVLAASLEHQTYYPGQETLCEILGFLNQCTGTMLYMLSAQLSLYLLYMVYKQLIAKANPFPRISKSRCLPRLLEGIYLFVPAALTALETGYPYFVDSKYGFSGSHCWIQAYDDDCNNTGFKYQVASYAVDGGLGIISVIGYLVLIIVYHRMALVYRYKAQYHLIIVLFRRTLLLMMFLVAPPAIHAVGIIGQYYPPSFLLSIANSVGIPLSSLAIPVGYLVYRGMKKSPKKKQNRRHVTIVTVSSNIALRALPHGSSTCPSSHSETDFQGCSTSQSRTDEIIEKLENANQNENKCGPNSMQSEEEDTIVLAMETLQ